MTTIDLNADLGEGFPDDARLLDLVTSASVCCGSHAGDPETILATLDAARSRQTLLGAHPGYADRAGFGRQAQAIGADEVERLVADQVGQLIRLADQVGVTVRFVKPHGALYNQAQDDEEIGRGVIAAVRALGLPLLGLPGTRLGRLGAEAGVVFITEGFPERRYQEDGRLVPRSRPDAVLHDPSEVADQVVRLARSGLATLCIHGDDPAAVLKAGTTRDALERQGIAVRPWRVAD